METVWRTSTELKKLGLPSTTLFRAGKEGKIATRIDKKGSREVILYNFRDCIKFFNINQLPHEIIEQEEQGNETKRNNPNPGNHSVNAGLALGVLKDAFEGQIEHLSQRADDWKKRALHYEKEISGLRFQLENSPKPQQWILLEKQNKSLKKWLTIKTFFMATLVLALGISIPKLIFHQSNLRQQINNQSELIIKMEKQLETARNTKRDPLHPNYSAMPKVTGLLVR